MGMAMTTSTGKKILSLVMTATLAFGQPCVAAPLAVQASPSASSWTDEIDDMLARGSYIEGEVLVGLVEVPGSKKLAAQPSEILSEAEPVMEASVDDAPNSEQAQILPDDVPMTLSYVSSDELTTEQLLHQLADDPRVVFAEPNYCSDFVEAKTAVEGSDAEALPPTSADETFTAQDDTQEKDEPQLTLAADAKLSDLTPLQWGNSNKTSTRVDELNGADPAASINVPNFGATGSNMSRPVTVAVLDNLVDYRLDDLNGHIVRFTPEQQTALGCYEWGYNAIRGAGQQAADFKIDDHASHCAGIIGAAWDGVGISGVASDARIMSIQVAHPKSRFISPDSVLRACAFIDKYNASCADSSQWVRVMSCSFNIATTTRAVDAAIRELGQKYGLVAVFSAGNDSSDKDSVPAGVGALRENPYVISVAATNLADQLAVFSDFGPNTITMGAPGASILSTISLDSASYLPDGQNANFFYEGFEDEEVSVGLDQADANLTQKYSPECTLTSGNDGRLAGEHGLRFPVSTDLANNEGKDLTFVVSVNCKEKLPENTQMSLAYSVAGRDAICGQARDLSGRDLKITRNDSSSTGGWSVATCRVDDACVTNGRLQVAFTLSSDVPIKSILFDSIGVGNLNVPYAFDDGTSMACPMVAGGVAVLAAAHPDENGAQLAARVRASVRKTPAMADRTVTGAVLDLSNDTPGKPEEVKPVTPTHPLYEIDLPLSLATKDPYDLHDGDADTEVMGEALVADDTLWYLPTDNYSDVENNALCVCQEIRAFDLKTHTWDTSRNLSFPSAVEYFSACVHEGKIYILGDVFNAESFPEGFKQDETVLLEIVPGDRDLTIYHMKNVANEDGTVLFSTPDGLKVYDKYAEDKDDKGEVTRRYWGIRKLDIENGTASDPIVKCDDLSEEVAIATHGDTTYLFDYGKSKLFSLKGETFEPVGGELPAPADEEMSYGKTAASESWVGVAARPRLVAGDKNLYVVGLFDDDKGADTWILPYGSTTLEPYDKCISSTHALQPVAAFYNGRLYAMAAAWGEQGSRVFRATQIETPGAPNNESDPTPAPAPDPKKSGNTTNGKTQAAATKTARLPKTGDETNFLLIGALALGGVVSLAAAYALRKGRKE